MALVQWKSYRAELAQDVERYVRGYAACHRAGSNQKQYGSLQPLEIPKRQRERIDVDFITKLPRTVATESDPRVYGESDTIIAFVDALTKRAHWVAAKQEARTAERFAEILTNS